MKKPIIGILGAHMSNNGGPAPVPADYVNHAYCAGVEKCRRHPHSSACFKRSGRYGSGSCHV